MNPKTKYIKTNGRIVFNTNSTLTVLVRSMNIHQFDFHAEYLINKWGNKAKAIIYVHREEQFVGHRKVEFDEVGQFYESSIDPDFWEAQKEMHKEISGD